MSPGARRTERRYPLVPLAVGASAALIVLAYRRLLGVTQRPSWPRKL